MRESRDHGGLFSPGLFSGNFLYFPDFFVRILESSVRIFLGKCPWENILGNFQDNLRNPLDAPWTIHRFRDCMGARPIDC